MSEGERAERAGILMVQSAVSGLFQRWSMMNSRTGRATADTYFISHMADKAYLRFFFCNVVAGTRCWQARWQLRTGAVGEWAIRNTRLEPLFHRRIGGFRVEITTCG